MFILNKNYPALFITLDVNNNTSVFVNDIFCNILLDSLKFCENKYKFKLLNYVIMPTHIHFIIYFLDKMKINFNNNVGLRGEVKNINNPIIKDFIKNFKSFTAKEILRILKQEESIYLSMLKLKKEQARKHYFSLWQDGEYITIINSLEVLNKKQKYIYDNPIKEKLVSNINNYKWIK